MGVSAVVDFALGAGSYAAGGWAAIAVATAYRIVVSLVIASIINRLTNKPQTPSGSYNRVQLPPNTYNYIPMVYGDAWMSPIVVDAHISADTMWMWYVLVYSEVSPNTSTFKTSFIANTSTTSTLQAGTIAGLTDIYWGDRYLVFNEDNSGDGANVTSWESNHGKETVKREGQPNGHLWVYNFPRGSYFCENVTATNITAFDIMTDSTTGGGITNPWTATNIMNNLCFQIVKVNYSAAAGLTGLPTMTSLIHNYQLEFPGASIYNAASPDPGTVFLDYLTNPTYGAGLPISMVNTSSLAILSNYSNEQITFTNYSTNYFVGDTTTTNRYSINGPLDTSQKILDNLQALSDCCDSWVTWNETTGQWGVTVNMSATQVMRIGPDHIYGGITVNPVDLNSTFNQVEITYPNTILKDQSSYYYLDLKDNFPNFNKGINEPNNKLSLTLQYTNNTPQAGFIAARRLLQSRIDYTIIFSMDYSGIQLEAGDVIGIDHDDYGWGRSTLGDPGDSNFWYDLTGATTSTGKLFRVQQVVESMKDNVLQAQITAITYDPDLFNDDNLQLESYRPKAYSGLPDAKVVSAPGTPAISNVLPNAVIPNFTVSLITPSSGLVTGLQIWYGTTNTISTSSWSLYEAIESLDGTPIPLNSDASITVTSLSSGTYYFAARAQGVAGYSSYSGVSSPVIWTPNVTAGSSVTAQNTQEVFMNASNAGTFYITHAQDNTGNSPQFANTGLNFIATSQTLNAPNVSINQALNLTPLTTAPSSPTTGMIAMTANTSWSPVTPQINTGTAYLVYYNGTSWVKLA